MAERSYAEVSPILIDKEQPGFVATPQVRGIVSRAMMYLRAGFPVHLTGPAGTGKTTIAMYLAGQIGRPVMLIHGDQEFGTSDLIGGQYGYRRKKVVDNFIQTVLKSEESVAPEWVDNRVTAACKNGYTLLYDEFTRSKAEANNVLLPILEEKILDLPAARGEDGYLRVSADFCAIFTSNPEEYAGVHKAQDALLDRMITIKLGHYDRDTETAIAAAKSGVSTDVTGRIVDIVRGIRTAGIGAVPTVRASMMLAKLVAMDGMQPTPSDPAFRQACLDVLTGRGNEGADAGLEKVLGQLWPGTWSRDARRVGGSAGVRRRERSCRSGFPVGAQKEFSNEQLHLAS